MTQPILTIGFACYRDFEGAWMTLQSLHAHHPRLPYLVIDNAPEPDQRLASVTAAVGGRYLHRPDLHGTSAPRDALFRLAHTDWVLCVDSHVLLEPGAVQALLDYAAAHPDSRDLLQGPMVYDDGQGISTHWRPTAPPGLWGTWDTDPRGVLPPCPDLSAAITAVYEDADLRYDEERWDSLCRMRPGGPPFDIPMQGLGLFAMRRQAWPGFHPRFQGFGGEEGYIHEKTRQRGGRCLCLPALRWRHRFRHMEHGAAPPPYPLRREDHVWNLLVGHRELGIDAVAQIKQDFDNLPAGVFQKMVEQSEKVQPFGQSADRKRLRLLGVWYTNNAAPLPLLQKSLATIQRAVSETMHHDVDVTTSSWEAIPGNPFPCHVGKPASAAGHAAIIAQMRRCLNIFGDLNYDGIVFLEHDVLYPPGYFDRLGDALATGAPVASNLDYEGLNATGWLAVKERHEPMHQLALRRDFALANLQRAEEDCRKQGWALLEPQGERADWVRLPPVGLAPAIHVNHDNGRFTSHGETVYEPSSNGRLTHPFWSDYRQWWPGEARPAQPTQKQGGCGTCGKQPPPPPTFASIDEWFALAAKQPSDFHEHMPTLRDLAARAPVCVEVSAWLKPALLALAAGKPKTLRSYCGGQKPEWPQLRRLLAGKTDFEGVQQEGLQAEPIAHDLLFIDTLHRAERVYMELARWAPFCRGRIALHTTATYGEKGDDGGPGVLAALRRFLKERPEWSVLRHDDNNHGLTVLSRLAEDKPALPSVGRQFLNFGKALARHVAGGLKLLDEDAVQARLDVCALCPQRNDERCAQCGCYLVERPDGGPGKALLASEFCPLGKWHESKEEATS